MKKMNLLKSVVVALAVSTLPIGVKGYSFNSVSNVPKNKVWNVKFNSTVDLKSADNKIFVKDSKGNKINLIFGLGSDNKSILIMPPQEGYKSGEKYTLIIEEGIKNSSGSKLSENYTLEFDVKKYTDNNEEEYKKALVDLEVYNYQNQLIRKGKGTVIDSKIITNYSTIDKGVKVIAKFSNGVSASVKSVLNYNKSNNIAVMDLDTNVSYTIDKNNNNGLKWAGNQLDKKISSSTIESYINAKYNLSLLDLVKKESSSSFREIENYIKKNYSSTKVNGKNMSISEVYIEKDEEDDNYIDVYLVMNYNNSQILYDSINKDEKAAKSSIEAWISKINNYISDNNSGYIIQNKVLGEFMTPEYLFDFNDDELVFESARKVYSVKDPLLTHFNVNGVKYYGWHRVFEK